MFSNNRSYYSRIKYDIINFPTKHDSLIDLDPIANATPQSLVTAHIHHRVNTDFLVLAIQRIQPQMQYVLGVRRVLVGTALVKCRIVVEELNSPLQVIEVRCARVEATPKHRVYQENIFSRVLLQRWVFELTGQINTCHIRH